jgi:alpha-amylase/alpha-mannosidase (GH57 family)
MIKQINYYIIALFCVSICISNVCISQPKALDGNIIFTFRDQHAGSVSLVGDFNGWSKDENPMRRDSAGTWTTRAKLSRGIFQYKFLKDGTTYFLDPLNPATTKNYNSTAENSVFVVSETGEVLLSSTPPVPKTNLSDDFPQREGRKPVYLNIIWHQHQPLYVNPETDQLSGPWVRTHATKDYYDMAAMLRNYPDVHCNINLTSSLLQQLRTYYVDRLGPFVDVSRNRVDVPAFWRKWKGKTDPWIDLALKPTRAFTERDKAYLYRNPWNAFGISEVMLERFPEYLALRQKLARAGVRSNNIFTEQELREIKFWFYLAHFDPDFLLGPVKLVDGSACDLSEYVEFRPEKKFYLKKRITEADCQRMVAEAYKVMANVIPVHALLRYDAEKRSGQAEIITTPYDHPILPLIYDSDLAKICQPNDKLPARFSYPQDANAQIAKAVKMYREIFGVAPTGMWPGEGSVAQPVLNIFRRNGILWTASDVKVLARSEPPDQQNTTPFRFPAGAEADTLDSTSMALVFRDTELSDRIGFKYQNYRGEEAAEDFVQTILSRAPATDERDVLVTVILDGENAWEWYRQDMDAKEFLNALYRKLSALYVSKQIITTTTAEYLTGNPARGIAAHPIVQLPAMKRLWPGSWINSNFDTWIGEEEENRAWEYLLRARQDLARSGVVQPDPALNAPQEKTRSWYAYKAWEEMYAAEGSDWFWWFGDDQTAPGGDKPFDDAYRIHLKNIYKFSRLAGSRINVPDFPPVIRGESVTTGQGTMARSTSEMQTLLFTCNAQAEKVPRAICIAGNAPALASWIPNAVKMYDDGTHGDLTAGDGIWSLALDFPVGEEIQYKYTNSGVKGQWVPGEEFAQRNRTFTVTKSPTTIILKDIFGK